MSVAGIELLDERLENERDYWSRKLAGHCVASGLPLDFARPEVFIDERRSLEVRFGPELCESLRRVCNNNETLVLVFLLTVTKICLHKYTDSEDITVGTTIHERYSELASFNKVLALRNNVSADKTCKELLLEVKRTLQEAYANQRFSYEKVLKLVNAEQAESKESLFNVVVILDDINNKENVRHLKNDVTLAFSLNGGAGVTGSIEYNPSLFSTETIERFRAHFLHLLHSVLSQPETRVSELDLLLPEERQSILRDFNDTAADYPRETCIHALFERQVELTPRATALRCGDEALTYAELNGRANRLARLLRSQGVGPWSPVAVLLEHSAELVVSLLAVLKAGGHYLPLDPAHPPARLATILGDARPALVITQASLAALVPQGSAALLVEEYGEEVLSHFPAENLPAPAAEAPAYVIYTSGSTGTPKGVAVSHRSLVNYVCWAADSYLRAEERFADGAAAYENLGFALYSSVAFDLTVTSVYVPLLTGNRVEVYARRGPALSLLDVAADDRCEVLKLTPSHLSLLVEQAQGGTRLRRLVVGGEALPAGLARRARERFGEGLEVYNEYGPTEATVGCMLHRFGEGGGGRQWVPVGRPAANTQIYVLDERMRPVPAGVTGEIYIGGDGLAGGYLGRPGLTADRFVPDPFSPDGGARLYRTGDLARHLAGGVVEYLGRRDGQVKYHGHRVELGELRAAVNRHPQVRDSVVVLREDKQGRRLVCYYVARQEVEEAELREYVARSVIAETAPSAYVRLGRMPLTVNGKVNTEALPEPPERKAAVEASAEAEAGARPVEELVRGIWCEVLRVAEVGAGDNFFELGGHSLLAGQVAARVRERLGVEVPLRSLFERPTARLLAELIEAKLSKGAGGDAPAGRIGRVVGGPERPLSFAQQRLWFMENLETGTAAYNVPSAFRLSGGLDLSVLERTLNEVIRRHEVLRTSFATSADGQPVQVIHAPRPVSLPLLDLSGLSPEMREAEVRLLASDEAQEPFDLTQAPLLRARLLKLSAEEHVALFTMHHIVCDGWSMGVLVREVAALYEAYSKGEPSPLGELPMQYADYAAWQRSWLTGEVLERQLDYWTGQLTGGEAGGELPVLELPADRPRPAAQSYKGAVHGFELSDELTAGLKRLSRSEGVTLYMLMLAAFQTLLHRYSGQEQVLVGTPSAGRSREELEGLIGFFVNTLVMRGDLSGGPSFKELLGRVREAALGAYAHQDVPFELLVDKLQPERDLSHTPLFRVWFFLQETPAALELPGLRLSPLNAERGRVQFDLTLSLVKAGDQLRGALEYNTDLFDEATVVRMGEHFKSILAAVVADPGRRVSGLPLLSEAERRQLLVEWNDTRAEMPAQGCVHRLFEQAAELYPEEAALEFEGRQLTYAELNARANRLARHLRRLGAGPESLVGILLERSAETVVAILGVLKAGAAYVPLDPEYPQDRLSFILEDARVSVLLTQESVRGRLPEYEGPTVGLGTEWDERIALESAEDLEGGAAPEGLAYVIYTSGSTGRPKGVAVGHRGLCNLAAAQASEFGISRGSRVLQFASFSFDASVSEVFTALVSGATLCVAPDPRALSSELLVNVLREREINVVTLPPAVLAVTTPERLPALRTVVSAGESCSPETVARWGRHCRVINAYGPTENTVCATMHECVEADVDVVPIGRPMRNTTLYLLDALLQPAPVNVTGEAYVGGAGVARGYLNRPGLTAERFIPDPFSAEPGARLYRTGDAARYRGDGEVEFVGRLDGQVKVRGYRVELGEVEAALASHAAVRDVVVMARDDEQGGPKQLVAYVVADQSRPAPAAAELREHAREQLPDYMTPSAFVLLEEMPLTPNGKVDRRALPAPYQVEAEQGAAADPRTPFEEMLCGIAADVLNLERVRVTDNFFEVGGHSLLATQFILRLREVLRVELSVRDLFEKPTIAQAAAEVEARLRAGEGEGVPPIERASRGGGLPASFAQQRLWFLDQLEGGSHAAYNMPGAFRLRGALDLEALGRTLSEVVRRHEVLRTSFATAADGTPVQVIHAPQPFAVPLLDLSGLPAGAREAEVRRLIAEEAQEPFDLTEAPLLRARLLRLSANEHVALFTMHHIVCDGWSMGVLVKEVSALYEALRQGEESPLGELPVQYADYAVWQRSWLTGEVLERQLDYWTGQLTGGDSADLLPVLELPTDHPRPAVQSFRGAMLGFELSEELSHALKRVSQREGATLYMTLLAAFQALLSRYSGQEQVLVGTTVANRSHPEVENLIGFFVNTLVMRGDLSGDPTFKELLGRTREAALGAYAHQDVPFELLVERLAPERDLSRAPLFQVVFTMQSTERAELALDGMEVSGLGEGGQTAKYDLVLNMWEAGGDLRGVLEYNSDLFEAATVHRLLAHFERLLEGAVANADAPLSELSLLTADEERALLGDFNDTAADYPRETCIHALFERQVELTPRATALRCGDEALTYAELNGRANRLARLLRSQGVGPWSPVAVLLEHSAELVVSLLAVLKAGGHYLPLDPAHPAGRLATILDDAKPALVISEASLTALVPEGFAAPVLLAGECGDAELSRYAAENLPVPESGASGLAYVIYTSGSTGTPKGVAVSHRSLVNYVCWAADSYLRAEERFADGAAAYENLGFALYSSIAFDLTVTSVYVPLLTGNRVEVYARRGPALSLLDVAADDRCEVLKLTPSHLSLLVEQAQGGTRLRRLVVGGEALPAGLARRARERFGEGLEVYNEYGPTEATVGCMLHRFGEGGGGRQWVPVGRPAANTQIYVLDRHLQPVPAGVTGEIYIGGDCLAGGYLGRPELTADRFVPDPFSPDGGARLYRTGDLARHLAGGVVEYLGRRDGQVKYHGHRVELGELRAAVNRHPQVRDSVVVLRKEGPGRERLVCYYVARQEVEEAELRECVARSVIAETAPSAYVRLGRMPLTVNGKVNTEALPEPPERKAAVEVSAEAEAGARPVEELVRGIWCEVLRVAEVGAGDNFFELGGHSLLAGQVAARVRERLGVEVPLRSLFERPTARLLAELIEAELVGGGGGRAKRIEPSGEKEGAELPLSFSQQRLWFLDCLAKGGVAYNVPAAIRLEGALDVEALRLTLGEVVRRHEALRTSFKSVDGQPVQVVHAPRPVSLPLFDLSELPAAEREAEARRLAGLEAQEPFDLTAAPLLRVRLLKLAEEEHVVLFTMHHIVCDGWSMGVLVKEVGALYAAYTKGEASPLSEPPVQYADYAVWQRAWLAGEVLERQLDYWAEQLTGGAAGGELPALELPTDRPRPAVQSFRGAAHSFELPAELSAGLKKLSRAEGVTLYMTLLAAFQTLLHRYSGQVQVLVGTPSANRGRAEVEGLIGFFVNTLVLRGDLSGAPTFRELLRRTREAALGAYAHQELPFELLVERLQPERDLSRTPLFQVAFAMQNADAGSLELEGLKLKPLSVENHTSKFDLGLHMAESGRVLTGTVEYSTDLFDASTIERLVGHYRELLEAVVADAGRCVADLPLLTAPERRQLLSDFNDTEADYPQGLRLHQTFEEQAARTPDATAFVFGEERVTYSELNRRANQLAHHLQACGVGPETCVAVCMERSAEMIVGLFGILKAGGAYVPLDLAYPHERLAHILEKTQAPVLLTRREHAALFPAYEGRQVWLDADWETIAAGPEENPQSRVEPENLAYVIFTSGSTGQPKGVAIPHAPAVALLQWAAEVFSKEELSGVLASTSICFDLSVFELFLPLSLGGKFILAENVLHLPALAAAEEVRLVNTVPSAMRELLRLGALPASVVTVNLAGEALARPLAEAVYALPQVERLYNLYGPSEDTTYSTWALVERGGAGVTIGRPVANSRAYVLDPRMRPVPIGVAGELYMGGDGLARGYLKRPAATAERFVPDPFGGDGGRLYHTGDLARYLPDGQIEYLGRGDQQVKIRGFRIEPGEVEAALLTHPSVKEALVLVDDTGADKRLVAYVVPAQPEALTPSDLQFHLKSKLPPYMVPGAYVVLERMPLTPNGKVDRAAARREGRAAVSQAAFEAPRTELERTVASVWKELLRVERVGVNDNFFDLGGHSLLAVQAHERLAALVGRELSLVDMFQYPTVSSLAEYLRQGEPARPAFEESGERATAQRQSARRRRQQRDKQLNAG